MPLGLTMARALADYAILVRKG